MVHRLRIISACAFFSAFSIAIYILASHYIYRIGFPLDDAWIHQNYARNLFLNHRWEFIPGQPSAGSTAPMWSALLATGYAFRWSPIISSAIFGWVILTILAYLSGQLFTLLVKDPRIGSFWISLFMIFEWHLVWSAGSGMETLLYTLIIIYIFYKLITEERNWFFLGVLIGISVWIRPDGITLLFPVIVFLLTSGFTWRQRFVDLSQLFFAISMMVVPYVLFNFNLTGNFWPNTFIAKQEEYKSLTQIPLWQRFLSQLSMPVIGAGVILIPGFFFHCINVLQQRKWFSIAAILWMFGYLLLYAIRLPVTYQHGRYVIPVMPIFFIFGFAGLMSWVKLDSKQFIKRIMSKVLLASIPLILLLFWLQGAKAYALDVAIIESEMVDTAKWINENTNQDALIAAHDIGALGYFGNRKIIDLAGLISPEVISFIRDEKKIEAFLNEKDAGYLVTFPGWYPLLTEKSQLIYQTTGVFSPAEGGENMAIYRWIVP